MPQQILPYDILAENARRMAARRELPDPLRGDPESPLRVRVASPDPDCPEAYIPRTMTDDPEYTLVQADVDAWRRLRCRHDFEYWCAKCCVIKHKTLGANVPLILNAPQRRIAAVMEADRLAGRPIRIIMLKARQWGGSTLIQVYMAWIQSCHRRNWHSLICSQVKDTSTGIRGMYSRLLADYPQSLWDGDEPPRFHPYERSANVREIAGRGCRVTVSSIQNQDAVRGADFAMAHLSETAFWPSTRTRTPADLIRAVCGSVALIPYSLIAMESTANGVGNYFHAEWLRCRDGHGDKRAVFVPWYEIEMYTMPLAPHELTRFANSLDEYETGLFVTHRCTLDQIHWYRCKRREYQTHDKMMAEYPTTDDEAFVATGSPVFSHRHVERLRQECDEPRTGELNECGDTFVDDTAGHMQLWEPPQPQARYVAAMDIGGRSDNSDYSVISVMRVDSLRPAVAAQWRGHIDHDILGQKAENIARYYNQALLAVESNTLETDSGAGLYILQRLADTYPNMYRRRTYDSISGTESSRVGFHTNRRTKEMVITGLMAAVRDGTYRERDIQACREMLTYEQKSNGSYGAKDGCHDDILMTRAIALHLARDEARIPVLAPYTPQPQW